MNEEQYAVALGQLRQAKAKMGSVQEVEKIVLARNEVLARFQPLLRPEAIPHLSKEEIKPFFYFENNKHWSGLFRQVNRICGDMTAFREALMVLVDETQPIATRVDEAVFRIKGLGKGIVTALLQVAYPDNYGVWNNISEGGLITTGLMPTFPRGTSFGAKYAQINEILKRLGHDLNLDLWTLDALWWALQPDHEGMPAADEFPSDIVEANFDGRTQFGLERHLHDFLYDNWPNISLGQNWETYSTPEDPNAGYEYPCEVGRIDILARHKHERRWLIVELKRGKSSDSTVGQVLRYMGWIQKNIAEIGDTVEGIIIAPEGDNKLHYAVSAVSNLSFMTYEVDFRLLDAADTDAAR
ncbi:endonuclease NucS domain-containing protein [Novosphingobium terrae]|uniref:endonuclease NucS domain-containing protein n=1 Tax=Novosphingobium terrae TaxID=2726189 RepID=UPI00197D455A|nr:endonuclease NucS domain-containing protein [Novosphingobium terrae]